MQWITIATNTMKILSYTWQQIYILWDILSVSVGIHLVRTPRANATTPQSRASIKWDKFNRMHNSVDTLVWFLGIKPNI